MKLFSILLLVSLLRKASSWQFKLGEQRYAGQEYLVNAGSLGLPSNGVIAAFGDFNGDQLLDVFMLSEDQRTVDIYVWDRHSYQFAHQTGFRTENGFVVVNIVPGDYNYDGKLDVLLMGQTNPGGWWGTDDTLKMKVYMQLPDGSLEEETIPSSTLSHPVLYDSNGDMRPDLLGFIKEDDKIIPKLWSNTWESSNQTTLFELQDAPIDLDGLDSRCRFPSPHFNAYVDLDGDCLADLFLMCEGPSEDHLTYQIWINEKENGYVLKRSGDLPVGTKSVGFADMDRDGTIDMVITRCVGDECFLSIAYNQQAPLCSQADEVDASCRDPESLCTADSNFTFNFEISDSNHAFSSFKVSDIVIAEKLVLESKRFSGIFPTPPAIGDYNIDGYPDLLLLTTHSGGKTAHLVESRPCDTTSCNDGEIKHGRRSFRVRNDGADALSAITDVESVHWVDMDDDGSLDILVQRSTGSGASRTPVFIKNNYFHDAFFLKALVLNGACQNWCEPTKEGEQRYRPYGTSYSGASFKFTVLDPAGRRRATQVGQLSQSSYVSLLTPYSYVGLGRTNNYVENLFIGSTRQQESHYMNIEGLIPNSQVVIDPYQPEGKTDPSTWSRELYLQPGDWIPWVTVVLTTIIIMLGGVVLLLHLKEKREDEMERRARLLALNFQAL